MTASSLPSAELKAFAVDVWESALQEGAPLGTDVKTTVWRARTFHLAIYGAGDDVTRREGAAGVVALHEGLAVAVHEYGPFAAHCLADEETLGVWVVEASGMELDELHVLNLRAGALGHCDAVAGGGVRIAGV